MCAISVAVPITYGAFFKHLGKCMKSLEDRNLGSQSYLTILLRSRCDSHNITSVKLASDLKANLKLKPAGFLTANWDVLTNK